VQRPTKQAIIDDIVGKFTEMPFTGDQRDGDPPRITIENFGTEIFRYGARALRAQLSRLTTAELLRQQQALDAHIKRRAERYQEGLVYWENREREEAAEAHRQRQAQRGSRPRLQQPIVSAARHYRAHGMNAKEAWDAVAKTPFPTDHGDTVEIVGGPRVEQRMCVVTRDGRQPKRPIHFEQWRQRYWYEAAKPG
jgi:hypothetical protein